MTAVLRFAPNDTLILGQGAAASVRLTVIKRNRRGYLLRSDTGEDDQTWSHEQIFASYVRGDLQHFACNLNRLPSRLAEVLETAWVAWPEELRFTAECREAYCLRVATLRDRGCGAVAAYKRAAKSVFKTNRVEWTNRAHELCRQKAISSPPLKRKERPIIEEPAMFVVKTYGWSTVRLWYERWVAAGKDIRSLVPQFFARGDRQPRKESKVHLQEYDDHPLCIYGLMKYVIEKTYLKIPRVTKSFAYKELEKEREARGFEEISYSAFNQYLVKNYSDFDECYAREGRKAAYYKYHLFERRSPPEVPYEEVEIDHCLLDIFVRDEAGNVARPWLTTALCRATKCIAGINIGFDVPCYATAQRAIIHAICPKDLTGLSLENDWPCQGVMDLLITDRGKEFTSKSMTRAARDVGFKPVVLPGRCPHLKGSIERFFGTLQINVIWNLDGSTKSRTPAVYDPKAKVEYSLVELTELIVRWIVDDYHQAPHSAVKVSPYQKWVAGNDRFGIRPVPNFQTLIVLMGTTVERTIQNIGIEWDGHIYRSEELQALRERRGAYSRKWTMRCDPYDRGRIWVLDDLARRWLEVPAMHQKTSAGITSFQARVNRRLARKLVAKGEAVTDDVLERAGDIARAEAAAGGSRQIPRYLSSGALATQVQGNIALQVVLSPPMLDNGHVAVGSATSNDNGPVPALETAASKGDAGGSVEAASDLAWEDLLVARRMQDGVPR